ncbi:hypothetical protein Val02_33520 [Virgisporangium aliadipatigenens]|uniref:Uncharacterized protein n=1 Tax=Virgisporangium aliadipatigenens TaxID=741659 RepID=A0A8J4DQX2_9ACTN|nr:hypothetical protein [Virgisporangium aliadipatigenens]GIJ46466.1 hypothetical protein Val02_33520 [Virgisporangium aliadipatigenens]
MSQPTGGEGTDGKGVTSTGDDNTTDGKGVTSTGDSETQGKGVT